MRYLSNAFSLSMLNPVNGYVRIIAYPLDDAAHAAAELTARDADGAATWTSVVGHAETAALFSTLLDLEVIQRRISVTLNPGDELIVGQYVGPSFPEGATTMPDGARIDWWMIEV